MIMMMEMNEMEEIKKRNSLIDSSDKPEESKIQDMPKTQEKTDA